MGKTRKSRNWRARQNVETVVDRRSEQKIKLDPSAFAQSSDLDESNILVLPSEKRASVKKGPSQSKVKKLSRKEKKKLQKVIEQKEKKVKRASILQALSEVQASPADMPLFMSTTEMQTRRPKRKVSLVSTEDVKVNTISGSNKKVKRNVEDQEPSSEESIDTSDISTDEEEPVAIVTGEIDSKDTSDCIVGRKDGNDVEVICDNINDINKNSEKNKQDIDAAGTSDKNTKVIGEKSAGAKTKSVVKKAVVNIPVKRKQELQESRLKLPILGEEQVIMETISDNPVVIICGETGSGKTTQVPQFLYEAGYAHDAGIIAITEPRRVAAISMSHRVATEMNLSARCKENVEAADDCDCSFCREVSYQIRYEGNVSSDTRIKFMTDGVLLKEVQRDFMLTKYSVVIIDEAHERSVYTDILIGLLSRIVPLRQKKNNPLKLIVMSATLRVEDFTENKKLFKITPPVIKVESRQYPVTIHFNKRTPLEDYLGETYKKVCKIHRMLPDGDILVFVTGQQEVHTLCRKLKQTFPRDAKSAQPGDESKKPLRRNRKRNDLRIKHKLPKISLDSYSSRPLDDEEEMELTGEASDGLSDDEDRMDDVTGDCSQPLYVLPLYSLMATNKQARVFQPAPAGCRLCVVATNVAETSLTIPGVKYVVDTGKVKTKFYDKVTGVSTFRVTWTSKASANQRAGRAGRVSPGHCYRLYSSAVFNDDFEQYSQPEIKRRPVDDLVLQMMSMNIDKVANFPYPTPPDLKQIKAAEKLLLSLGAIEIGKRLDVNTALTMSISDVGRAMSCFPVSPRYGKMLSLGHQHDLLPYVIAIVSALSIQEVFTETYKPGTTDEEKEELKVRQLQSRQVRNLWAGKGHSLLLGDLMVLLKAVGSCEYEGCTPEFCEKYGLRYKAMKEIRKLRAQLTNIINLVIPAVDLSVDPKLNPPNDLQAKLLRQIVLSGLADHVARKCPDPIPGSEESRDKKRKHAYECTELAEPVFIHPTSVLYKQNAEFVIYQQMVETGKMYMKGVVAVEPEWLPVFAPSYCTFSQPMEMPSPRYDEVKSQVVCHMTSTFGPCSWGIGPVELDYPPCLNKCRWFSRFLMEGSVVPKLKDYVPDLLGNPSIMSFINHKSFQPRHIYLLTALSDEEIYDKAALVKMWRTKPEFLLREYSDFIPLSQRSMLKEMWPPI